MCGLADEQPLPSSSVFHYIYKSSFKYLFAIKMCEATAATPQSRGRLVHAFMSEHCLPSCRTSAPGRQGGAATPNSLFVFNESMTNECVTNIWAGVTSYLSVSVPREDVVKC